MFSLKMLILVATKVLCLSTQTRLEILSRSRLKYRVVSRLKTVEIVLNCGHWPGCLVANPCSNATPSISWYERQVIYMWFERDTCRHDNMTRMTCTNVSATVVCRGLGLVPGFRLLNGWEYVLAQSTMAVSYPTILWRHLKFSTNI